jgi:acyl transferase domain-containing protein
MSQVYKAEFSQPLCTAVQIMVVNLLRDWGIKPAAVLGHSSGEIAAAYACGALTMDEAIICGYLRGKATKQSTETPGAMAAVGLGSTDIQPYLVDGIVIACENSPSNTTLSGDEDKIMDVLEAIKHAYPDVLARRLQVDMAYHSRKILRFKSRTIFADFTLHRSHEKDRPKLSAAARTLSFWQDRLRAILLDSDQRNSSWWLARCCILAL